MSQEMRILPVVALRGMVAFPNVTMSFDIGRETSREAVREAMAHDQLLLLVTQRSAEVDEPEQDDLYNVGTLVRIRKTAEYPQGGGMRVVVEGIGRAVLHGFFRLRPYLSARAEIIEDSTEPTEDSRTVAAMWSVIRVFKEMADKTNRIDPKLTLKVMETRAPGLLADIVAGCAVFDVENCQKVLEIIEPEPRLELLCSILQQETEVLDMEGEIMSRVGESMTEQQKARFLHEQMRAIQEMLGEGDDSRSTEYRDKLEEMPIPEECKKKILDELDRLDRLPRENPEYDLELRWIETAMGLPWGVYSEDSGDIAAARKILDEDHDGLEKVKDRILEYLAVLQLTHSLKGPILCLVGPPGVGKTSIARSIARAMGRKFTRMSLGGVHDEAEIRGHRRTYVGAIPGRILSGMKEAGTSNPLFLLDELDKTGKSWNGDPASALLEVLDSEQNSTYRDHYLDMPFDLSQVLFLATANNEEEIPEPLLDRMEIVRLEGYTTLEKIRIARNHLIPKEMELHGLKKSQLSFTDKGLEVLITAYTREAGVRSLEREIGRICRRTARLLVEGTRKSVRVSERNLEKYLGVPTYHEEADDHADAVGLAHGLAWTSVGGVTLPVEVNTMPGGGHLELTGSLGDVMKESAQAALGYIRAHAEECGLDPAFYKAIDIHIHFPAGATPKDGPSAGITMATALVSALTGKSVRGDVAMTGEITIRGRVMAIGGLKEKSMAAHREGYSTLLFPAENLKDWEEVDPVIRESVSFIPVRTLDEVLAVALRDGNGKTAPQALKYKPEKDEPVKKAEEANAN